MGVELTYNSDFATFSQREKFESFGTSLPFFISVSNPARIASFAFFVTSIFSFGSDIDVSSFDDLKKYIKSNFFIHSLFSPSSNILTCFYA
jgi:hypothetical protein